MKLDTKTHKIVSEHELKEINKRAEMFYNYGCSPEFSILLAEQEDGSALLSVAGVYGIKPNGN